MNDLEARFARLLNDSVDADLAGRRQPPPFTAVPRESSRYATTFSRWRTPILAAAVFAVIIAGTAVGLTRTTSQNRSPADRPVGSSAGSCAGRSLNLTSLRSGKIDIHAPIPGLTGAGKTFRFSTDDPRNFVAELPATTVISAGLNVWPADKPTDTMIVVVSYGTFLIPDDRMNGPKTPLTAGAVVQIQDLTSKTPVMNAMPYSQCIR